MKDISYYRHIFFYLFIFSCLPFHFVTFTAAAIAKSSEPKGECRCAAFVVNEITDKDTPLITQATVNLECTTESQKMCQDLCITLARTSKEAQGAQLLCEEIGSASEIKPSIFSKLCDGKYVYSGLTAKEPVCCSGNKEVACATKNVETPKPTTA